MRRTITTLAIIGIVGFFTVGKAHAASFGIVPAHPDVRNKTSFSSFEYQLLQSESKTGEFALVNLTDTPITVSLKTNDKNKIITFDNNQNLYLIKPQDRRIVAFAISIDKKLPDGEYPFVISGQTQEKGSDEPITLPFKITVGKVKPKEISAVINNLKIVPQKDTVAIYTTLTNTGEVALTSLGFNIALINTNPITSLVQKEYRYYWGEKTEIQPNETKKFQHAVDFSFLPGQYNSTITLDYGEGKHVSKKTSVSLLSTKQLLISGGVGSAGIIFLGGIIATIFVFFKKVWHFLRRMFKKQGHADIHIPNIVGHKSPPIAQGSQSEVSSATSAPTDLRGAVSALMKEERELATSQNINQEKIFFEVRKIIRQEIELWKEMETFRKDLRDKLYREEEIKKRIMDELSSNRGSVIQ